MDTIELMQAKLAKLLPEARIAIAHGQMRERELERVMREFHQQRHNLLLCSTIIETGIDIPTANTILIHRADKFGLAQLHQLRGRVGRSHHQAYAYLLTPPEEALGAGAKKRLEAIQSMEQLGSGFYLAMHDLEIRGAGEVLGESQSGEIQEVGFNLYVQMLDRAVRSLKAGKSIDLDAPLDVTTEINLHVPALLPEAYCNDVHERLTLYKRLANCDSAEALDRLFEELIDRFGLLPEAALALLECHRLRVLAKAAGVARVDATHEQVLLQFAKDTPVDVGRLVDLVQRRKNWRMSGPRAAAHRGETPVLAGARESRGGSLQGARRMRLIAILWLACALGLALGLGAAHAQRPETSRPPEAADPRLVPAQGALERGDFAQAIDQLRPLAARGDAQAGFLLGLALELAPEPLADREGAHDAYLGAANSGHAAAQNNLGAIYFDGRGVQPDYVEAARWYRAAAEQGNIEAQHNLALLYGKGLGVAQNDILMAQWLTRAARAGSARAMAQLGRLYLDGEGVPENPAEAVRWFRAAAERGHGWAQFYLAALLQKGHGVARDLEAAHAWFARAADGGNVAAMQELSKIYELGSGRARGCRKSAPVARAG